MNKKGLTSQQVEVNREKYGTNALSVKESQSVWEMFVDSFKDPWIMILAFAFVVKCVLNIYSTISGVGDVNWFETIGIVIAIILSTGVGTYSSYKNEQDYNALQAESSKIISKVYRDGKLKEIMIDDIVKDDLVLLQAGDKIPVDGIIISGNAKVDQAALTGESEEVKKEELGDNELPKEDENTSPTYNKYKVFRGSTVMSGELVIKATELGDNTLLGSINTSLQEDSIKSPSAEKLEKLAKNIGILGYSGAGLYTVIRLIQELFINKTSGVGLFATVVEIIMYAITIIIMAVPEGLPMMLALVSSMNGRRLSKQHILVRHSDSIETAGYINKLFSDKTGTITEGKLSVVDFILGNGIVDKFENLNIKQEIINGIGLNNDSNVVDDEKGNKHASGSNNTDRALLDFLIKTDNLDFDDSTIISKEEFNSANKFASVTLKDGTKYIKGAPEFILTDIKYYLDKNGEVKEFTTSIKDKFEKASVEQATRAMRILAIIKEVNNEKTLIAGVCIRDNVREGISNTVKVLNKAGVDVVMVTGDRKETAVAIAKEAGIINSDEDVILTHEELDNLSDNEVKGLLSKLKVVARALPDDKKRLVKLSQQLNLVVGMTGDGINDSPALKSADVGFSMGDGTSVAQEASDIVIVNNSLSSIEKAILYGRTMTRSVQKFLMFQLTVNVATIAMAVLSPLFGIKEPFSIIAVLWINLIMDTFAALMFGKEPALDRYMTVKPVPRKANILTGYMKSAIMTSATFITFGTLAIMNNFLNISSVIGTDKQVYTFMFTFFIYAILFNSFNTRSTGFNLLEHIKDNKNFSIILALIAIVQTLIIQFGGKVFDTVPMDIKHYGLALVFAFLVIPFDFIRKAIIKAGK